jgi:hypothetical protein
MIILLILSIPLVQLEVVGNGNSLSNRWIPVLLHPLRNILDSLLVPHLIGLHLLAHNGSHLAKWDGLLVLAIF